MNRKATSHYSLEDALRAGPPPKGNLAIPVFHHGSMEAELYVPVDFDPQTPHSKDEIYVVASGTSEFFNGIDTVSVTQGAFLFVPAGTEHRFSNFSDDFRVWVIFYGPEGGEEHNFF